MRRFVRNSWFAVVAVLGTITYALAEDITMTTFYPSPRGVYNQLRTMGQTTLAETGGNVGIGTTSPIYQLQVNSASNDIVKFSASHVSEEADVVIEVPTGTGHPQLNLKNSDGEWILKNDGADGDKFKIRRGGTADYVTVLTNGNVGIGTAAPATRLEVNGVARFTTGAGGTFSIGGDAGLNRVQTSAAEPTIRLLEPSNAYASLGMRTLSVGGAYGATAAPANGAIIEGNVGIGTTAPANKLDVAGNVRTNPAVGWSGLDMYVNGANRVTAYNNAGAFAVDTAGAERVRILATGNVGIGTTAPGKPLHIKATGLVGGMVHIENQRNNGGLNGSTLLIENTDTLGQGDAGVVYRIPGQDWYAGIDNDVNPLVDVFRIAPQSDGSVNPLGLTFTPVGNVGIGTTAPSEKLHVIGNIYATGSVSVPSDARFKTQLAPLTGVLEKLDQVQAVSFERNALGQSLGQPTDRRELGVLAQELEQVYPELVTTSGPEAYRAVDYSRLTVVLLEGLKELKQQNAALQEENRQLMERYSTLEQRVNTLEGKSQ